MKLQLALDLVDIVKAKHILKQTKDYVDIVEVGTPFIIREGIKAVKQIKEEVPYLKVLADLKIMDAGEYEALMAFEAGCDIVTVLGVANDATIKKVIKQAHSINKAVMVDMIEVKNLEERAEEIDEFSVDYISVHTAFDIQSTGKNPLSEFRKIKKVVKNAKLSIAGGIRFENLQQILNENPNIIVIGSGITTQDNIKKAAYQIKKMIDDMNCKEVE